METFQKLMMVNLIKINKIGNNILHFHILKKSNSVKIFKINTKLNIIKKTKKKDFKK